MRASGPEAGAHGISAGAGAGFTESSTVREILTAHPDAEPIFDRHGLVGCGGPAGPLEPVGFFARVHRVDPGELLDELNAFVARENHRSADGSAEISAVAARARDTRPPNMSTTGAVDGHGSAHGTDVYPPFIVASLALALGAGLLLGLVALWQVTIGLRLDVDSTALIEAHGNVQLFGFVVLFVAGVALHVVPRFRGRALTRRRSLTAIVPLVGGGALLRVPGQLGGWPILVVGSGLLEAAGVLLLAWALGDVLEVALLRRAAGFVRRWGWHSIGAESAVETRPEPREGTREAWEPWVLWGIGWLVVAALLNLALSLRMALIGSPWTPPALEDPFLAAAFLGFAGSFVAGIGLRTLPLFMALRPTRYRLGERALVLWQGGVVVTVVGGYAGAVLGLPPTGGVRSLAEVPALVGAALGLAGLAGLIAATGVWARASGAGPTPDVPGAFRWFVRAGFAWLAAALLLIVALEASAVASGSPPLFTRVQAARHAIALGFVTQLMLGMASRIGPVFRGRPLRWVPLLWLGFAALNLGVVLRVVPEYAAGYTPPTDPLLAASGALAFTGIAACAVVLARMFVGGEVDADRVRLIDISRRDPAWLETSAASTSVVAADQPAVPAPMMAASLSPAGAEPPPVQTITPPEPAAVRALEPSDVGPDTNVGWLLDTWPGALPALLQLGFEPLADPALRAQLAPTITLGAAAAIHQMPPGELVDRLRTALSMPQGPDPRRILAMSALRAVLDPEIPVNVVDLGLLRGLSLDGRVAHVRLTLTFPGCPSGPYLEAEIEDALTQVPGIDQVRVEFEFEPPWSFDQMTPDGRAALQIA